MDRTLKNLYYNSKTGYSGANQLYKRSKKVLPNLKLLQVKAWLAKQPTYTLHKPAKKHFTHNKVLVSGIDEQWQADLVDLQSLSKFNGGYKFLLNCIDLFSKYAWSLPLRSKTSKAVLEAFQEIFRTGRMPYKLQTDAGKEFINREVQNFLKTQDIHFFTTKSELKASVVERFNRTLKEKMWRYFTAKNTYRYIDVLADLLENYNNSYHRTIGTFPANVDEENEQEILNKVFRTIRQPIIFKFDVGDNVRISKVKRAFEKGFWPNWTEEWFTIKEKYARTPPVYTLQDQMGETLEGVFYEPELQKIHVKKGELLIVDKILNTRRRNNKTEYLVHWRGYPSKFDSWVSTVVKL